MATNGKIALKVGKWLNLISQERPAVDDQTTPRFNQKTHFSIRV